ncbi:MAG: hypothetical protein DDT19_01448 [Syntrophomonadaceae bacterium]|nr:hypothetical protein [Bacillota bacterium]
MAKNKTAPKSKVSTDIDQILWGGLGFSGEFLQSKSCGNILTPAEEEKKIEKAVDKMVTVRYENGLSQHSNKIVDYMVATIEDENGDIVELYAEMVPRKDKYGAYEVLKQDILWQAGVIGFPANRLEFWFDHIR